MNGYIELISGNRRGVWAGLQRTGLSALAAAYRPVVGVRNVVYDRGWRIRWLPAPVISLGNITTGGTGKTPMAIWLCRRLCSMGHKPAVVSRGYKAPRGGGSDEMQLISRRCPEAICVANPNRPAAGALATGLGADVAIMDDGFQHRRLGRDLDVVLIDATCPFGYEHLLPRGLLREPLTGLQRADLVVITRFDQAEAADAKAIVARIEQLAPTAAITRARHRPVGLVDLAGESGEEHGLGDARVICFAAIGNPRSFAATARQMGMDVVGCCWWPDHHRYTYSDAEELSELAREHRADLLVTTEKDAVRLVDLDVEWPCPVRAVRIEVDFIDDDDRIVGQMVSETIDRYRSAHARR